MILNDKQFRDKVKRENAKVIYVYEGHAKLDHSDVNPFERLGSNGHTTEILLEELAEFSKMYPDQYSVYIYTTPSSIIKHGLFMKVDLRVKETETSNPNASAPVVDREALKKELKNEINLENKVVELTEDLIQEKKITAENELISNKLASVGLEMLKQFGMEMNAPMQGTQTQYAGTMNIDESFKLLREKLGDEFLLKLAERIKNEPNLADQLKNML